MRKLKFWLPTAMLAVFLVGCDSSDDQQIVQQPAPVQQQAPVVQQQPTQPEVVYEEAPQQQPQVVVVQPEPQVVYRDNYRSGGITAGHVAAAGLGYLAGKHLGGSRSYGTRRSEVHHYYHSAPRSRSYFGSRGRRRR